jgi:excisionase family DNA binding protein
MEKNQTRLLVLTADEARELISSILNEYISQTQFLANTTQNPLDNELLSVKELCQFLKISKPTLFKKMKDGTIPYTRIGRRILFKRNEVINSLKRRN